jgi:hypothetical protein
MFVPKARLTAGAAESALLRVPRSTLAVLVATTLFHTSGCGPGAREVPAPSVYEDPGERVRAIARVWQETTVDQGFLEGDPNGVVSFRIESRVRVELDKDGRAREQVVRQELFRMRDGREFHCVAEGVVAGAARYRRQRDEIRVDLSNGGGKLPRRCQEPGFPVLSKDVPPAKVTFALRSERLIAVDPPHVRATLLPAQ